MSTNSAPSPTLQCKECAYENEPERVYCHNCGAKLDRSVLPKEEQIRRESPAKARKRIIKMTNPGNSPFRRELSALVKTIIYASLAAMVIEMARPPENVPPAKTEPQTRLLSSDLSEIAQSPIPKAGTFTEAEINSYLKGKVVGKGDLPGVEFKRAYVDLEPGTARIIMEKAIYGYSLYMGTLYRVEASSGVLTATNLGGNIGRLPIHPLIMERVTPYLFGTFAEATKREYGLLTQMQSVVIRKDRVDVVGKGTK